MRFDFVNNNYHAPSNEFIAAALFPPCVMGSLLAYILPMPLTDLQWRRCIDAAADNERFVQMLKYADALREWGDEWTARGWEWLARHRRTPQGGSKHWLWFHVYQSEHTLPHEIMGETYQLYNARIDAEVAAAKALGQALQEGRVESEEPEAASDEDW